MSRRSRWVLGVSGAILASVVVAAVVAYGWWPRYRPDLMADEVYGIDVSHHQGPIGWPAVAGDDIEFAYIKATEGADWVDPRFEENWTEAAAAGVDRGAYHFFTFCRSGREQALNFLSNIRDDPGELPPAVDLELAGNCARRPSDEEVRSELEEFLDTLERETGVDTVLYVGDDWEAVYPVRDALGRPLWHRRIFFRPDRDDWWIWQYTGWADVAGISGGVDMNVMRRG